jgi:hypothetical protein
MPYPYLIARVYTDGGRPLVPFSQDDVGWGGYQPALYFKRLDPATGWPEAPPSYVCDSAEGLLPAAQPGPRPGRATATVLFSAELLGGHDAALAALARAPWAEAAELVWGTLASGHEAAAEAAATTEEGAARLVYRAHDLDEPLTVYVFRTEREATRF